MQRRTAPAPHRPCLSLAVSAEAMLGNSLNDLFVCGS